MQDWGDGISQATRSLYPQRTEVTSVHIILNLIFIISPRSISLLYVVFVMLVIQYFVFS